MLQANPVASPREVQKIVKAVTFDQSKGKIDVIFKHPQAPKE